LKRQSVTVVCHSEQSEESLIVSLGSAPAKTEMFRFAANDDVRKYLKINVRKERLVLQQCVAVLVDYVIPAPKITLVL